MDQENLDPGRINLMKFLQRWLPKCLAPKRFKCYSWLHLKYYANEVSTIDTVLSSEELFLQILKKVNEYYIYHKSVTKYIEQEGLEEYKGPQNFADKDNKTLLYYYGLGWWKWYKKSEFDKQLQVIYQDDYRAISLLLHGTDPFTPKVDEKKYEFLLKMTHEAITKHLQQENWKDKLELFSGPQCNEDRGNKNKCDYNPNLHKKLDKEQPSKNVPNIISQKPKPSINCPKEIVGDPDSVQGVIENDFRDSYFRVCRKCSKTRILDIRAANKFPLGSYYYAEQMRKIVFECSRLVGTDCSVPEDVVADEKKINDPVQLLILKTKNQNFLLVVF